VANGRPSARVYGKVRTNPEYVGRLSGADPDESFADWLDRATGFAYHEGKSRWEGAYKTGATHGLLFRASTDATATLLATVIPSQDSVGRAFPLMTVTSVTDASIAYLPVSAHRGFFSAGAGALRDARRAGSLAPATAILPSLESPGPTELADATTDFTAWQEGPVTKLWKALFPRDRAVGARRALEKLTACAAAARADRGYARLPLGSGGGAAACFWLHVLGKLTGDGGRSISIASWSLEADGALSVALAREPPVDFWLKLWLEEPAVPPPSRPGPQLSAAMDHVLRSPEARIRDLLDAVEGS
jgi:type VI secretion system ImpM family protein